MNHTQPANQPGTITGLGLRLPPAAVQSGWKPWEVVDRAHGFHVSREAIDGTRVETITNTVGKTLIFRSRGSAERAALQANFTSRAVTLAEEPLLGGRGGAA